MTERTVFESFGEATRLYANNVTSPNELRANSLAKPNRLGGGCNMARFLHLPSPEELPEEGIS